MGKIMVSWDIAGGGAEWVVQFWNYKDDGTKELIQQLSRNSDEGGSFDLTKFLEEKE